MRWPTSIYVVQMRRNDGVWFNAGPYEFFRYRRRAQEQAKLLAEGCICPLKDVRVVKFAKVDDTKEGK